ncbi:MAG: energy transducer TonB, partial [Bacteroidetes bacterium]|nr:energy transducer TonB [Bacteroidota bacterium]
MEKFWKKNKNGLTGTVLFHVLILLLLLFAPGFSSIFPPPEGEALLINFGTSDSGSGMIQPERVESTPDRQRQESIQSRDEIPTQDIEDAPVVKTSTETQDQQE